MYSDEIFSFSGATFDSRLVKPGMLYVALKGSNVDGNDFIPRALEAGAAKVIGGENALQEVQDLAKQYRLSLSNTSVIALTGSAGKTTTKEFLRTFLSSVGKTYATQGNYNNHLGLPITILNCPKDARFLVLEMGTNHPGEIEALCNIALPDSGLITNIGTAHIEFFTTQEAICKEKGTLLAKSKDYCVAHADTPFCETLRLMSGGQFFAAPEIDSEFAAAVAKILPGKHNLANASIAFAMAQKYGVSREDAIRSLEHFCLPGSRWRKVEKGGIKFIDDTYNANPDAMKAALSTFAAEQTSGRKIAVLGDMFELGEASEQLHNEVFEFALSLGLDAVYAVGSSSSKCRATGAFLTVEELKAKMYSLIGPGDTVLLKASNAMKLGKLTE